MQASRPAAETTCSAKPRGIADNNSCFADNTSVRTFIGHLYLVSVEGVLIVHQRFDNSLPITVI